MFFPRWLSYLINTYKMGNLSIVRSKVVNTCLYFNNCYSITNYISGRLNRIDGFKLTFIKKCFNFNYYDFFIYFLNNFFYYKYGVQIILYITSELRVVNYFLYKILMINKHKIIWYKNEILIMSQLKTDSVSNKEQLNNELTCLLQGLF